MEISVAHPAFQKQQLVIQTAGFFSGPRVLLNGVPVKHVKGKYNVSNDDGVEFTVQLNSNFVDPIPALIIGKEKFQLARALTWYEYLWIGVPIILIFIGGGLGAGIGVFATYTSSRILRSDRSSRSKYLLTGIVSIGAFIAFFVAVVALEILIARFKQ